MPHDIEKLVDEIRRRIHNGQLDELRALLAKEHPADVAEAISLLPEEAEHATFDLLDHEEAGQVLDEADESTRAEIVEDLSSEDLSEIVSTMPPDEAADLVGELPDDRSLAVLELIPDHESEQIEKLLQYPPDSAGGIMTPVLVRVREDLTVGDAVAQLRSADIEDEVFYVYAIDASERLVGTVPLRRLVTSATDLPIANIMNTEVESVPAAADQELIAQAFEKYDLFAVPVVDDTGRLLGRITVDDVVEVIEEEMTEDIYKMAGTDDAELATDSVFKVARIRMSWLLTCLAGTMVAGLLIHTFEGTLAHAFVLAAFIPAIMAMGGNSGMQTCTITVRGLATGEIVPARIAEVFFREARVAAIIGLVCGVLTGVAASLWGGQIVIGVAVGVSMFLAIMLAATLGLTLPLLFKSIGVDPAVASGPLITTGNDIVSLSIYLVLATMLLKRFGNTGG